jgi:hypothetical protein
VSPTLAGGPLINPKNHHRGKEYEWEKEGGVQEKGKESY